MDGQASPRWLVPAAGLAASVPVIVSVINALGDGWRPIGDRAVIALRSVDVLTAKSPLLGQFSASSGVTGEDTYSLGPMLYWLLAIPARISPGAIAVTAGAVAALSIVMTVALANRRGGAGFALFTALGLTLVSGALPGEVLHDVWNPYIAIFPTGLLLLVAWSLACGDHRFLPLVVVLASFAAQSHLAYVLPAVGAMVIGVAGLWWSRRQQREHRQPLRRWVLGAVAAGLVCWSLPLAEQFVQGPGNFAAVIDAASDRGTTLGSAAGWNAVVRAVGAPPWWLDAPARPPEWLSDVGASPGAGSVVVTLLVLFGMLLTLGAGLRRRRGDVASAAALGLVVCVAVFAIASGTPTEDFLYASLSYTLGWSLPAGVVVWGLLGWSVVAVAARRARRWSRGRSAAGPVPTTRRALSPALGAAGVAIVAVTGAVVASRLGPDPYQPAYEEVGTALGGAVARLPPGRFELDVTPFDLQRFEVEASFAYELRRRGVSFTASDDLKNLLGDQYGRRDDGPTWTLRLAANGQTPPGQGLVLADVVLPPSEPSRNNIARPRRVAVWLQP